VADDMIEAAQEIEKIEKHGAVSSSVARPGISSTGETALDIRLHIAFFFE
jgi:hypothetical protein